MNKHCVPCHTLSPLPKVQIDQELKKLDGWQLTEKGTIQKSFKFSKYREAVNFANKVADLSEKEDHHPHILIKYWTVQVDLTTYAQKGLTDNDFILAAKIDQL